MTTIAESPTMPIAPESTSAPRDGARGAEMRKGLAGIAGDIGLPVGTYYALHAMGVSDSVALGAGAVAAAVRIAVIAVRTRRVTAFSVLMLTVYAVGLGMTFVSGDPHLMLVKDSVGTAVVGAGFLISLATGRPLVLDTTRTFGGAQGAELVARYATEPAVRRTVRGLTAMWGVGLLVDAVVRVPVVYLLPISVGVGVSHALSLVMIALLAVASGLVVHRARRAAAARQH